MSRRSGGEKESGSRIRSRWSKVKGLEREESRWEEVENLFTEL